MWDPGRSPFCRAGFAVALLTISGEARAGAPVWISHGPFGGTIYCLARNPSNASILLAGALQGGVFRTTDAGAHWAHVGAGSISAATVKDINFSPSLPSTAYAATDGSGVFRTTDGGNTWAAVNGGLQNPNGTRGFLSMTCLATDPQHPGTVFAGSSTSFQNAGGVYRTTDGGDTWHQSSSGLPSNGNFFSAVRSILIDPAGNETVYAGFDQDGLYRSTDGGSNWSPVTISSGSSAPTPDQSSPSSIRAMRMCVGVDPLDANPELIALNGLGNDLIEFGQGGAVKTVTIPANYPQTFDCGPPAGASSSPAPLYVGTGDVGMLVSTDGGSTWAGINAGLPATSFLDLSIDGTHPGGLAAATGTAGIFGTTDAGASWSELSNGVSATEIFSLAVDPASPATIYAASSQSGLYKSTDASATWSPINTGLSSLQMSRIFVDPKHPSILFSTDSLQLYRSTDAGLHWAISRAGLPSKTGVTDVAAGPAAAGVLYAGVASSGLVFRSTDDGASWKSFGNALPSVAFAITADPFPGGIVYVATTNNGVYKTTDAGLQWLPINTLVGGGGLNTQGIARIAADPGRPGALYARGYDQLFASTDAGASWSQLHGLQDPVNLFTPVLTDLVVDPVHAGTLYLAAPKSSLPAFPVSLTGVLTSSDGGATWTTMDAGLTTYDVRALALVPGASTTLYAATDGGGVLSFAVPAPPAPRQAGSIGSVAIRNVGGRG